jgi:TatA/E family protein of Tat protein translocase
MDTIAPWELLIIVLAIGLLFGANRLPHMARSPGDGIRQVHSAVPEDSQPCNPDATQEPSANRPLGR